MPVVMWYYINKVNAALFVTRIQGPVTLKHLAAHTSVLRTLFIALALLIGRGHSAHADPAATTAETERGVRPKRLALIGGAGAVFHYLGFKYVDRAWYQGQQTNSIRWIYDWGGDTYVNLDKGGHFMGGIFMAQTLNEAYAWAGFSPRKAALLGTMTSWAALLEVEMRDAYFDQWGFSVPDFVANTLGASIPLVHAFFPRTRAVRFKFGYHPSRLYLDQAERAAANRPHIDHIIDDYEGMTFWATLALDDILVGRGKEIWPDWLGLALGYGATGLHGSNVKSRGRFKYYPDRPDARPEIIVALDYDARYLPGHSPLWDYFKNQLNWLHLPSPAVRIYPDLRFYFLYM